jgi:hypothetical protein
VSSEEQKRADDSDDEIGASSSAIASGIADDKQSEWRKTVETLQRQSFQERYFGSEENTRRLCHALGVPFNSDDLRASSEGAF